MSELVKKTAIDNGDLPKKLFSDEEINSNKILEIDYKDLSDPIKFRQFSDAVTRNQHYNKKKE